MLPAFLLGLALGAPPVEAETQLIEAARRAAARGDAPNVRRCLRGWASLRRQRDLPPGLEREAAEALSWAEDAGTLRIYGSRSGPRAKIGVEDPAGIVGRVDAWGQPVDGERYRLIRAESEAAGRFEYGLPPSAASHEIVVEAVLTDPGPEVVLRRAILIPSGGHAPPARPDPKKAAEKLGYTDPQPEAIEAPDPAVSWWWIAAGVLAAGLVGAAIWQETR